MTISVDPKTFIITILKADLTLVQSTPTEIRDLNLNIFRLALKAWESSEIGIYLPKTHNHNTEVSLGGLTFARVIEIVEPYTVTFENGQYAVNLVGANSNVGDKVNVNQVSVRSQNSAGLISSPEIEYASFKGGVIVDIDSSYSGTAFPIGTEQKPVNNLSDALLICEYRGFKKLYIHSDLDIDGEYDLSNFEIVGQSHVNISINVSATAIAQIYGVTITDCRISGVLDGDSSIANCIVGDIDFFNGHIHDSSLIGTIYIDGNINTFINNCSQLDTHITPVFDMGGSGQSMVMTNYTGIAIIRNFDSLIDTIGVGLNAGSIILDSNTVTSGTISVSGTGTLVDENNEPILSGTWNGGVTIINTLLNKDTIREAVQLGDYIYIDTVNGVPGTEFPVGIKRVPSNNLADAMAIYNNLGAEGLYFLSDYTFVSTTNISDYKIYGDGIKNTKLTFESGCIVLGCEIFNATLTGNLSGISGIYGSKISTLGSVGIIPSDSEIFIVNCLIDGVIVLPSNYSGKLTVLNSYSNVVGESTPTLDFGNSTAKLQLRNYTGGIKFDNITQGNVLSVDLISGQVRLTTNCTNASISGRGIGKLIEDATGDYIKEGIWNGGVTIYNEIISKGTISTAVWDELLYNHVLTGTTGRVLSLLYYDKKVYIDITSPYSGNSFPIGTNSRPVNNLADAVIIASDSNIKVLHIIGTLTIDATDDVSGYTFIADRSLDNSVTVTPGAVTGGTYFTDLTVSGTMNGDVRFTNCVLGRIDNFNGGAKNSLLTDSIYITGSGANYFTECDTYLVDDAAFKIIDVGDKFLNLIRCRGNFEIMNKTGASTLAIDLVGGYVYVDSTCTAGTIFLTGLGEITFDTGATSIIIDNAVDGNDITNILDQIRKTQQLIFAN